MPVDRVDNYYYKGANSDVPQPDPESCKFDDIIDTTIPAFQSMV